MKPKNAAKSDNQDLSSLSDTELNERIGKLLAESNAREEKAKLLEIEASNKRLMSMTQEAIDLFVPDHSRTSCDDGDLSNGYIDNGCISCERYFLMQASKYGHQDVVDIDVTVRVHKK